MLKEIKDDVFCIVRRIKDENEDYVVFYNVEKSCFELYSKTALGKTYELNLGKVLDCRCLKKIRESRIDNLILILKQIEENNKKLNSQNVNKVKEESINKFKLLVSEVMWYEFKCYFKESI